jgi:hypothetical protein
LRGNGGAPMPTYRIFTVSHDGHLSGAPEVVECTDDVEAVKRAMQVVDGLAVEIRDNSRIVARRPGWRKHCKPVSPIPLPRHTEPLGMDEKNIEVNVVNGVLIIKGEEKQGEKEEKKKDYYLRERSFGSFQRAFQVPDGVDIDKI